MKSLTSIIGWLLLVAVLAVPSFLFYNWWTKNKQQASSEIAQEQTPADLFPAAEKNRSAAPAPAAAPAQPAPAVPARPAAQPAAQAAPKPQARPEPAPQAQPQAEAAVTPVVSTVQASTAAVQEVSVSTQPKLLSYYAPKGTRDPTLSPADYSRIKEAELQRLEAERQQRQVTNYRPKEVPFETRLQLQGIVGNAAIINGDMYVAGQTIYGAKILKVGSNYVLGEYKGKKFKKVLK
ncbi:MAG: hypothetical protein A2X35_10285 [Elusimicrobia bacterium GWA2_61_42]|nr:MAG: hypothetical protein A2X35_10285 [Elusimicrobia bacterium GWA2_61_42]OGR74650.1 MAG: hypothetical protein A2X38_02250 [Elusimicrobia bacterium GWC2_61_25]